MNNPLTRLQHLIAERFGHPARQESASDEAHPCLYWVLGLISVLTLIVIAVVWLKAGTSSPGTATAEAIFPSSTATETVAPDPTTLSMPTPHPTSKPTETPFPTGTSTPTPDDSPTPSVTPTPTMTSTPAPTLTPTPAQAPLTSPTPTPAPPAVPPVLLEPFLGREYQNPITFRWKGSLGPGQAYRVVAYHPESGYAIRSELLTTQEWITYLPLERYGEWRWRVEVMESGNIVAASSEGMFWFQPFPGPGVPAPTASPTPTFTPSPAPVVAEIRPNATTKGIGDIGVTIIGQNFLPPGTAWLGEQAQGPAINVVDATATSLTGRLSTDLPTGVYGLTVQNPDGQRGQLSPAFVVYPRPHPKTTFESDTAFIATTGPGAGPGDGDDDHVQVVFFELPDTAPDNLFIRIFDADTGGVYDKSGGDAAFGDTVMTYTVRGGVGAYTHADARSDHPGAAGINAGSVTAQSVAGADSTLDNAWLALPVARDQGEPVGDKRIFKLVVQGAGGDDTNGYQVAISSVPDDNVAVTGARFFVFSWCLVPPLFGDDAVPLFPFVPAGSGSVTQHNFDFDGDGSITVTTPLRNLAVSAGGISGDGVTASEAFSALAGETASTWSARYRLIQGPTPDAVTLWFSADGVSLPIFTAPTMETPP